MQALLRERCFRRLQATDVARGHLAKRCKVARECKRTMLPLETLIDDDSDNGDTDKAQTGTSQSEQKTQRHRTLKHEIPTR